jgi:DNA polymerase-3 subunit gamma/tau
MNYQVLARKYRPRSFKTMVGQESILRMLSNALEQKRLHHAYLLTGTRGVGKTTMGRILAKCLNCETGVTPTPCEQCPTCKAIDAGQFLDLYEVDAASRTKVEDTRELLDNVMYPPTQGRYKVYLIDEVHMLSNHSFNALLKTLEEPPEHVKFFLCTTDPKRLPATILSRCLQFHLKRITPEQIATHLQHICEAETIQQETTALEKLAKAADGSMRDALSLLDQAIAYGHGSVKTIDVHAMLGSMAQDDLMPLLDALARKDSKTLFTEINMLADMSPDFQQVLEALINLLHRIAVAQIVPEMATHDSDINTLCKRFSPEEVQLYYQIALLGRRDLALTPNPQQGFEMTMLRMIAFVPSAITNLSHPERSERSSKPTLASLSGDPSSQKNAPRDDTQTTPAAVAFNSAWADILPKLELSGMAYALASNCVLDEIEGGKVKLRLGANHQPMLNQKLKDRIAEALQRVLKQPVQLDITLSTADLPTPHKQNLQQQEQQLSSAKQAVLENPLVKQVMDMYDASVEVALVT